MQVEEKCCDCLKQKEPSKTQKDIISPSLQKSIDNIIKEEGYITYNVNKRMITADGGNYLATLCEIDIKGRTKDGEKETNIFVKNIINDEALKGFFCVADVYLTESFVYTDLSKMFTELQEEANVPLEERYKIVKGFKESNSEAIILENVAKKGFKTPDRMEVPPLKFVELSVQQLAKFHGLSYIIQKKRPEYFEKKISKLNLPLYFNDHWQLGVANLAKITTKNLKGNVKTKVESFIPIFLEKYPQYQLDKKSTISCMCHGDYRANNILMKKVDGVVTEVIPIDYQLIHYGCPVNDFIYFIFGCTDRAFRDQHLDNLKDMYFNTLREFLKYFDMDINDYYPRKEFETIYRHRFDYSLMIAMFFFPLFFAPEDNIPDCGKESISDIELTLKDWTYERFKEILDECVELGFL